MTTSLCNSTENRDKQILELERRQDRPNKQTYTSQKRRKGRKEEPQQKANPPKKKEPTKQQKNRKKKTTCT
jgi:hypothetical protein